MAFGEVGLSPSTPDTPGTKRALQAESLQPLKIPNRAHINGRAEDVRSFHTPHKCCFQLHFPPFFLQPH